MTNMNKKLAIQANAIETWNFDFDSSLRLALEAQLREYEIFFFEDKNVSFIDGKITAKGKWVKFFDQASNFYNYTSEETIEDLSLFNILLIRQDPPFDMKYITNGYLLDMLPSNVVRLNKSSAIRNYPEKFFTLQINNFFPPTVISEDFTQIESFINKYEQVVFKPLYSFAGDSVFLINHDDVNIQEIYQNMIDRYNLPIIAQKFLPEVRRGDIRVMIIDGKIIASMNRKPPEDSIKANLVLGGIASKCELSPKQQYICQEIANELVKKDIIFAGVDLIGDYVTEVNTTSPTGIVPINSFYNIKLEAIIFDALEKRL
jgi:glutathione synthase